MRQRRRKGDLSSLAHGFLGRIDPEGRRFASRAASAWKDVVGEEIARHTMGSALRGGELLVYVDSPTWANELSMMSEHLRERLNEALGEDLVRSVRFSVSRRVREEREREAAEEGVRDFYERDEVEPVPLSDVERAQVEYAAASIHDPELREAAVRAMARHLEWKKGLRQRNGRQKPSE